MSTPPSVDPDSPDEGAGARPLHIRLVPCVLVLLGGSVGTAARYALARTLPTEPGGWPAGTFLANVVGSFVLGTLLEALLRAGTDTGGRQRLRLLLGTGFCGGFTTYSTLAVETDLLVRDHHASLALAYIAATVGAGILATVLGIAVAARRRGTA